MRPRTCDILIQIKKKFENFSNIYLINCNTSAYISIYFNKNNLRHFAERVNLLILLIIRYLNISIFFFICFPCSREQRAFRYFLFFILTGFDFANLQSCIYSELRFSDLCRGVSFNRWRSESKCDTRGGRAW